jgi:hypothetical protein
MTNVIDFTSKRKELIDNNRTKIAEKISDIASMVISVVANTILMGDEETIKTVLGKAHKTFAGICEDLNKHRIEDSPQITIEQLFTAAPLQAFMLAAMASIEPDKSAALVLSFAKDCGYSDKTIAKAEAALGCIIR